MSYVIFHLIEEHGDLRYAVQIPERRKDQRVMLRAQREAAENGFYRVIEWHDGHGRLVFDEATVDTAGPRGDAVRAAIEARRALSYAALALHSR
jgi:hypothetical protein